MESSDVEHFSFGVIDLDCLLIGFCATRCCAAELEIIQEGALRERRAHLLVVYCEVSSEMLWLGLLEPMRNAHSL